MSYEQELKSTYAEARARLWRKPLALASPEPERKRETTRETIIRTVCDKYDVTLEDLQGNSKNRNIISARNECFYRFRHEIQRMGRCISMHDIGKAFNKHHTSVMDGINKHAKGLANV